MKRRHKTLLSIFIILAAVLVAVWVFLPTGSVLGDKENINQSSGKYATWEHDDSCFILEVVDTVELRRKGLSGRESLATDHGMLFLYELSGEYGFWMKDMNFPIDIIWLDRDDQVVTIESQVQPESYPHVFYPAKNAKKVIEVSAGVTANLELDAGDQLSVSAPTSTPPVDCTVS